MQSYIVTEDNRTIRALARQALKGKWLTAILTMLLATAIGSAPGLLLTFLFPESEPIQMFISVYSWFITGPLTLGLMGFYLKLFRQQRAAVGDALAGFSYFRNAMGLYLVMMIKIFLWSLLFVIPGIIAAFRYSQAWFILADEPTKDPESCLQESSLIMEGNKDKLFNLSISFIGWMLIASAPQIFIEETSHFGADSVVRILISTLAFGSTTPLSLAASMLTLFVRIYIYTAYACFYDLIRGNLLVMDQDQIMEENPFSDQSGFNPFSEAKEPEIIDVEATPAETADLEEKEAAEEDGELSDLMKAYDNSEEPHDEDQL